ncbi:MAG TPA: nucleotidyltransferase domain-containing protein [Microbacterium sp.]|jgi:predicted nucleotidyltransferase|uniref:nucleotidyltransferase domain-containing protein n=1 Tax=Microbacterium sp. TaxID=51671 RepID=UPI002F927225
MFSATERTAIRAELITLATEDPRIAGAALAGSAARGTEDAWSDIDLLLQLDSAADEPTVVDDWSDTIDTRFGVADTLDVFAVGVRYRVFLLRSSLQIDVSFWPPDQFRATEPAFHLLFGTPNTPTNPIPLNTDTAIGLGWLYALHARSAIARGKLWQADMMIDELRNRVIDLKCSKVGLNSWHGREVDALPRPELEQLEATRVANLTTEDLEAALMLLTDHLLDEVAHIDVSRAARLEPAFVELRRPAR